VQRAFILGAVLRTAIVVAAATYAVLLSSVSGSASVQHPGSVEVELVPIATGFVDPIDIGNDGVTDALYVAERSGAIWRLSATGERERIVDLSERVFSDDPETGLFSFAFHPEYPRDRRVYVNFVDVDDQGLTVLELRLEEGVDPGAAPVRTLFDFPFTSLVHFGGELVFGPDGMLYVPIGDGFVDAPIGGPLSRSLETLRGKVLRLDVNCWSTCEERGFVAPEDNPFVGVDGARPEIWAFGLRNPYRAAFDPVTGSLLVGDVGSALFEEVNEVAAGGDYGWNHREGPACRDSSLLGDVRCIVDTLRHDHSEPIASYLHLDRDPQGGNVIVGGAFYLGSEAVLSGRYLFSDFQRGTLWSLKRNAGEGIGWRHERLLETGGLVSAFGNDLGGEVYLALYNLGSIVKVAARP
jgi:hypothetical protein